MRELERYVGLQTLRRDPVQDLPVRRDDTLGGRRLEHALAEQRRVRVETLLVEPAQDLDALVERLAGDEACGAELHAVLADQPLHAAAVRGDEDALAQAGVEPCGQRRASSQSLTSRMRRSSSVRWPSAASIRASTPGMRAASQCPCETGTKRSSSPCRSRTGRLIAVTSKPQPVSNARSSSTQPSTPGASAVLSDSRIHAANSPVSTARSAGPSSVSISRSRSSGCAASRSCASSSRYGRSTASPSRVLPNSTWFSSPMPSSQSRPSASLGATAARLATATQRSSQSAAHASTCGPPPETPQQAWRSSSSASAIASTSAAQSATRRPACRVEPP